jgi:tRNA (mo5U34)-methyltransferase
MNRITNPDEIRRLIAQHDRWWHEIELAPGIVTPGDDTNREKLPVLEGLGLPESLKGMRALDLGCSDGFFSFELEKRGAAVTAMDFVPATHTGFDIARRILGSHVDYRVGNVYSLNPDEFGEYDIVFFLGVLYHLRRPQAALDAIRSVMPVGGQLYVASFLIDEHVLLPDSSVTTLAALNPLLEQIPLWQAYRGGELNGDYTNCFAPNMKALHVALEEAQFRVEGSTALPGAGFVRASAISDPIAEKYQRLDARIHETPLDPSVPYYLDEEGAVHDLTGRRPDNASNRGRSEE